jgi:uncharacterized membrane protein
MIIRKKYLFFVLGIISSLIAAAVSALDSAISYFYISDPWIFTLSVFLVGTFITLLISLLFSIPVKEKRIGAIIDPSFTGVRWITKSEVRYHIFAGLGNTVSTVGYIYVLSILFNPSTVLPFYQIVILYLLLLESITEKNAPTLAELQSSIIVAFGAILGSISLAGFNIPALMIVFFVINPGWVILSIYQRKLKLLRIGDKPNDAINIRLWNLIFTTLISLIVVSVINTQYLGDALAASLKYFPWLALSMGVTFFSYVLYIRALGIGKASITQAVKSSTVIFAIPASVLLSLFIPFVVYETPELLMIKMMGLTLVVLGIISFALTTVKAYIIIQVHPGFSVQNLINKIWDIQGVESISATAGSYDLVAKIRTRTLGKGYDKIIQKLEGIDGIKELKWQSVLKEWEEI